MIKKIFYFAFLSNWLVDKYIHTNNVQHNLLWNKKPDDLLVTSL